MEPPQNSDAPQIHQKLINIGFSQWFVERLNPQKLTHFELARVTSVHKDSYFITNGVLDIKAELTGRLMYSATSTLDLPTVGDWCYVQILDQDELGIIHEVIERKSYLKRKTAGKKVDFQAIASNIDKAFIMQSLDDNYNIRRLERYLVMVNQSNITPIILLSKSDLIPENEIEKKLAEVKQVSNCEVVAFSNQDKSGLGLINKSLGKNETFCLLGSSGVGKTTLINSLLGSVDHKTGEVRQKDSKGKHTTTHRELIQLKNNVSNAMIIDVPGMRELGNFGVSDGLETTFSDITKLFSLCQFSNCTHANEKNCAVTQALENGELSQERYNNYLKMDKESQFLEMSYFQKRSKDKNFHKMIKKIQATNRKAKQ